MGRGICGVLKNQAWRIKARVNVGLSLEQISFRGGRRPFRGALLKEGGPSTHCSRVDAFARDDASAPLARHTKKRPHKVQGGKPNPSPKAHTQDKLKPLQARAKSIPYLSMTKSSRSTCTVISKEPRCARIFLTRFSTYWSGQPQRTNLNDQKREIASCSTARPLTTTCSVTTVSPPLATQMWGSRKPITFSTLVTFSCHTVSEGACVNGGSNNTSECRMRSVNLAGVLSAKVAVVSLFANVSLKIEGINEARERRP
jgi:hypothetical protein